MALSPLAGRPAPPDVLIDVDALVRAYYERVPDPSDPQQRVSFGTSGHRGTPLTASFNEAHVLAMTQAICEHRAGLGIDGPLYIGMDTHAVSAPAQRTTLEVLAANGVDVFVQRDDGFTPTPAISHAILTWNRGRLGSTARADASSRGLADGIVVTPSHNPPKDGGFKYNPPHGGPADTDVTAVIQKRANELMKSGNRDVRRIPYERALRTPTTHLHDYVEPYVADLASVIDLDAIRAAGVRIGVDPLGGASVAYWEPIRERYGLDLTIVNPHVDPRFAFMTLDHDGQIRMDCSSPYAMAKLIGLKDRFAIAFGNDADCDRHGIVTPSVGLMNPNHYLAVAIDYLFARRPRATAAGLGGAAAAGLSGADEVGNSGVAAVGKTVVSSSLIDRVTAAVGRRLVEVPVGFKWFVSGLLDGSLGFAGEESAGASFLRRDGTVWTTDKDGIIADLLAAEIVAVTGKDPGDAFAELAARFGTPHYMRIDAPATPAEKSALARLSPDDVTATTLAGEPITAKLTRAPGNGAPIGGLKVIAGDGWFAARPSGTEDVYKIYAESLRSAEHLDTIVVEARDMVSRVCTDAAEP